MTRLDSKTTEQSRHRNYVTIDINRRIMEDYFGYTILFVMNITDVEDKIVSSARRAYLLKRYQQQAKGVSQVTSGVRQHDSVFESTRIVRNESRIQRRSNVTQTLLWLTV